MFEKSLGIDLDITGYFPSFNILFIFTLSTIIVDNPVGKLWEKSDSEMLTFIPGFGLLQMNTVAESVTAQPATG